MILCDLTQSYAPSGGGGISTYLREKRDYVLNYTPHHLLQIVPGPEDKITVNGRHIFAEVAAPRVHGSPNYRFILRTKAVREGMLSSALLTKMTSMALRISESASSTSARATPSLLASQ